MAEYKSFKDAWKANRKNLKLYVPVVERVHGARHQEMHAVRQHVDTLTETIKSAGKNMPVLDDVFDALRKTTANYTVPEDVCESYEAVYRMLAELDQAYHA